MWASCMKLRECMEADDAGISGMQGRVEYLIKWQGYKSDENTWEPEDNVSEDLVTPWAGLGLGLGLRGWGCGCGCGCG